MPAVAAPPADAASADQAQTDRILKRARADFFARGYSALTMEDLATELGMSKKTLYQHFAGKDAIVRAVIVGLSREIRADAEQLLRNRRLNFAEKLRGFAEGMAERMQTVTPHTVRDLQRFAPALHDLLTELRQKNIPYIFGRFIEEGQITGMVRTDIDAAFTIEFYLHAVQGLLQPATLERLGLAPREAFGRAVELYFGGLLTPAGRNEHEKLFPR